VGADGGTSEPPAVFASEQEGAPTVAIDASGFRTEESKVELNIAEIDMWEDGGASDAGEELTLIMLSRVHFVKLCSIDVGIAVPKSLPIGPFFPPPQRSHDTKLLLTIYIPMATMLSCSRYGFLLVNGKSTYISLRMIRITHELLVSNSSSSSRF
jgi:hypothetical protein